MVFVESRRYQGHFNFLMYSPPQLRMMLPSFALQRMSGQVVWTHPPKLLLVWQSNLLIFLGPFFRNAYISSLTRSSGGPFIVLGALSLWRWENSLTFAIMMVFRGWQSHHYPAIGLLGRWFAITLVFSLCRRRRAGRGRSLEEIQEGPIEYAFSKMSNDCPRNTVRNPVWDANY